MKRTLSRQGETKVEISKINITFSSARPSNQALLGYVDCGMDVSLIDYCHSRLRDCIEEFGADRTKILWCDMWDARCFYTHYVDCNMDDLQNLHCVLSIPHPNDISTLGVCLHELGHVVTAHPSDFKAKHLRYHGKTLQQRKYGYYHNMQCEIDAWSYAEKKMRQLGLWNDKCEEVMFRGLTSHAKPYWS